MDDPITTAFRPLIGLPCWGADKGQGSMLTFEFGPPHLVISEPIVSTSASPKIRARMAQRRVRPVGAWHLFVFCCHWRVVANGEVMAHDESTDAEIFAAVREMDGQKLVALTLDTATCTTTFSFDLGAVFTTWPYEADADVQWSLYLPDGNVLTYRADGLYCLDSDDQKPEYHVWHPLSRKGGIRVS